MCKQHHHNLELCTILVLLSHPSAILATLHASFILLPHLQFPATSAHPVLSLTHLHHLLSSNPHLFIGLACTHASVVQNDILLTHVA